LVDIKAWLGPAVHAGPPSGALPAAFRNAPSTVVLAYTVVATALLLGLVGLVGLVQRRSRGPRNSG
jgi:hypothetical protein